MASNSTNNRFMRNRMPIATASITGSESMPNLNGYVDFYSAPNEGTIVSATINGLPGIRMPNGDNERQRGPYGFHIHEGTACGSPSGDAFQAAGEHYNPTNQPHPLHAGDLPTLFPSGGQSYMQVYTNRFSPRDVIGRTVVIHESPDDYHTQPSGNSGARIGCGVITRR